MAWIAIALAIVAASAGTGHWALGTGSRVQTNPAAPAPTRIVTYVPPATLPARIVAGNTSVCQAESIAAWYRTDAHRCLVGNQIYDPCFATSQPDRVLCDVDPRDPSRGLVLTLASPLAKSATAPTSGLGNHAWFFELADGSICQPFTGTRREISGLLEVYACRFAVPGTADAVLGDLDNRQPQWTIQQVLINKKSEPPTMKSTIVVTVKAVWQ